MGPAAAISRLDGRHDGDCQSDCNNPKLNGPALIRKSIRLHDSYVISDNIVPRDHIIA